MKVYHFSTYTIGGAAIAARRLHDALGRFGVDSRFFYSRRSPKVKDPSYMVFDLALGKHRVAAVVHDYLDIRRQFLLWRRWQKLHYYTAGKWEGYEGLSYPRLAERTPLGLAGAKPDIVHLHWISDFIDYPSFFASLPDALPVVWTLHDMNPFTGGCHYSWDCQRFEEVCRYCPQLNDHRSAKDLAYEGWRIKHDALAGKTIHVVADSYWLERQARKSALFAHANSFRTIHYGLDTGRFVPRDKSVCKRALGIPADQFVISFGAESIDTRRKGLRELIAALQSLTGWHITALVFGRGDFAVDTMQNCDLKQLGRIETPELLSLIYSAADLFVIPSLYEAFGQTAMEALACGTPVVGFDTGGIPDIVRDGRTGLLAKRGDAEDLARKITWMIEHPAERVAMGRNGRQNVQANFTLATQAQQYVALYQEITSK